MLVNTYEHDSYCTLWQSDMVVENSIDPICFYPSLEVFVHGHFKNSSMIRFSAMVFQGGVP
jgi:alpha-N-acetylglucosamine transferase